MSFIGFPRNDRWPDAHSRPPRNECGRGGAEQKSFTKAAKQLGLSPARVSELVRTLEERVGVRLVGQRTTRSVAGKPRRERLLRASSARCSTIIEKRLKLLNDFRSKPAGTLRLTIPPPAADFRLLRRHRCFWRNIRK